jgi:hypothetical protein
MKHVGSPDSTNWSPEGAALNPQYTLLFMDGAQGTGATLVWRI